MFTKLFLGKQLFTGIMNGSINEKISVVMVYNSVAGLAMPRKIRWRNTDYFPIKLAYHHQVRQGRKLLHVFHVTDGNLDFCLELDTESLARNLREIYDRTAA